MCQGLIISEKISKYLDPLDLKSDMILVPKAKALIIPTITYLDPGKRYVRREDGDDGVGVRPELAGEPAK